MISRLERFVAAAFVVVIAAPATAQQPDAPPPPPPPKMWTTTAGFGLALTSGNADSSTFNANYNVVYDPKARNIVKSEGLYIRGQTDGELSADRLSISVRDELRLDTRAYVFGQNQYLRDSFKEIDYLLAPTAGGGYKFFDTDRTRLSVDAGIGGVWEKNPGFDVRASGAVTMDEKFSRTLSTTATLTQSLGALWKFKDFGDALYQVGTGVAVATSSRTQIKLEALSTYKTRPPTADIEKNDVSLLIAFVFKS